MIKYKRILLKLSGEALMGNQKYGIDPQRLSDYADDIKQVVDQNVQVAIVIGGGNIFRGMQGTAHGFNRVQGDYMGMLATVIDPGFCIITTPWVAKSSPFKSSPLYIICSFLFQTFSPLVANKKFPEESLMLAQER